MFKDVERPVDLLKSMLVGALFEWSCVWVSTHCIPIFYFLLSFSSAWFVSSTMSSPSWTRCTFINKTSLPFPKKKKKIQDWFAHVMCKGERVRKTGLILVEGMKKGVRRPKITLI